MTRIPFAFAAFLMLADPASAQDRNGRDPTTRGLLGDTEALTAARTEVARIGVDCEVSAAALRARGENGDRQYEVACRHGPGYLILSRQGRASGCLLLASQAERFRREGRSGSLTCRLPGNRNPLRHYVSFAAQAGVSCRVDEGRVVGLAPDGGPIYEIGCRNAVGAWIEQDAGSWIVTDCLDIRFRGDVCEFTAVAEELAAFKDLLRGSPAPDCTPTRLRSMGRNAGGLTYVQVACGSGEELVASMDGDRRVIDVLPCVDAAHIGGGCQAIAPE